MLVISAIRPSSGSRLGLTSPLLTTIVHAYLSAELTLRTTAAGRLAVRSSLTARTTSVRSNIYAERTVALRPPNPGFITRAREPPGAVIQLRRTQPSIAVMEVTMSEFQDEFGGREPADDTDQYGGQQPADDTDQFGGPH